MQDDGNGIDFKGVGNRTYWVTRTGVGGSQKRELADLPNVVRNNRIYNNQGGGMVVHVGNCRGLHVYNNEFSYNWGSDGSAMNFSMKGVQNGLFYDEYQAALSDGSIYDYTPGDLGEGLFENIFIYRNMIYKNGYIAVDESDATKDILTKDGVGRNGISIKLSSEESFKSSIRNVWIVNNTIAYNHWYGLGVYWDDKLKARNVPSFDGLHIVNNIFAMNTGDYDLQLDGGTRSNGDGVQLFLRDQITPKVGGDGFICSLELNHNCYYNERSDSGVVQFEFVVNSYILTVEGLSGFSPPSLEVGCVISLGSFGVGSIEKDPLFIDVSANNFHIDFESPCVDAGTRTALNGYEGGLVHDVDFEYRRAQSDPDMGADEIAGLHGSSPQHPFYWISEDKVRELGL